jgi:hypothetical protein
MNVLLHIERLTIAVFRHQFDHNLTGVIENRCIGVQNFLGKAWIQQFSMALPEFPVGRNQAGHEDVKVFFEKAIGSIFVDAVRRIGYDLQIVGIVAAHDHNGAHPETKRLVGVWFDNRVHNGYEIWNGVFLVINFQIPVFFVCGLKVV